MEEVVPGVVVLPELEMNFSISPGYVAVIGRKNIPNRTNRWDSSVFLTGALYCPSNRFVCVGMI